MQDRDRIALVRDRMAAERRRWLIVNWLLAAIFIAAIVALVMLDASISGIRP